MSRDLTVLWVDASVRWDGPHKRPLMAGIAVVDKHGGSVHTESIPRMKPCQAEQIAVRRAFVYARSIKGHVEIRTDSSNAIRALTPPNGIVLTRCHRDLNLAHSKARLAAGILDGQPQEKQLPC